MVKLRNVWTMFCYKRMSKPNWYIWQQTDNLNSFHNQKSFRTSNLGNMVLCSKISILSFSFVHFWDTHFWTIHIVNVFSPYVAYFSIGGIYNKKCLSEAVSVFCLQSKLHVSSSTSPMFFLHYPAWTSWRKKTQRLHQLGWGKKGEGKNNGDGCIWKCPLQISLLSFPIHLEIMSL